MDQDRQRGNRLVHQSGTATDTPTRLPGTDTLLDGESLYRSLIEKIPGIIYVAEFGPTAPWHYVSPQIEEYFGLTPEEWIANPHHWLEHVHPEDREIVLAEEDRVQATGTAFFADYRMRARDGRVVWFRDESMILRKGDNPPLLYGILYDVTAQREAQLALGESEERLRLALEAAHLGMWVWDPQTDVIYWDERECALYGVKSAEAPRFASDFIQMVHPEDREWIRHAVREALRTGTAYGAEYRVKWPDGSERWLASAGRVLRSANGATRVMRGITYDVTDRRGLEEHLRRSQKMEAVGQLAGGIAHDFNNLLTVISGHVELLLDREGCDAATVRNAEAIRQAANRAAAITRQLLAFSRKQVLQPRSLELRSVVREISVLLRRLLGPMIDLDLQLGDAPLWVQADESQLEQVVLNLVINARDAMPNGGEILVTTDRVEAESFTIRRHPGMPAGQYVRLIVRDTGVGMDAETQARIFEPFFTTKALGKGTGLGLATVYGVVKQSGGWIWVESAPGEGATFEILLPEVAPAEEPRAPLPITKSGTHATETLLLVDDEEAVREVVTVSLVNQGYKVLAAESGAQALEVAAAYPGTIHVLITDAVMPGMSGPVLAQKLREIRPDTRVLYISGYAEDASVFVNAMERGEVFLQKPFTLEALGQRVRALVES